ncbi:NAD(P)-dependent alcohol dehydrogenase [Arthrobacter sp. CAU 1506]|uniref:NAD(P)-dependent alcohol dehydrogenase n=1 Tax=Arthrobacter sp. CAU 1506 TaxID=2560052 RepID=UPI0010ABE845|nr:NAD(P)-dependent alcohol dehydrogenase [Arthrobacter sp. CAU 1506]TJY70785.1 NAD(P)-dependent alcohol dehydrogenase [Arthrobacter sp. CAU 1506]
MGNAAAVMTGLNSIEIQERPMPEPLPGQAVIRVEAVGVCGSDVAYYRYGKIGPFVVDGPFILGHEVSGEVVAVGDGVDNVQVGDRVAVEPGTPDRSCEECRAGRYHLCPNLEFLATPPYDGALLQYLAMDARCYFPIPDSMSYEDGALLEPLSVGLWGCQRANLQAGDDVLITGAGPVGLLAAEAARALGAGSVTLTDISDFRLGVARDHGFAVEKSDAPTSRTFDVLLECSGANGVLAAGLGRLHEAGRAAVIGLAKTEEVPLPLSTLNWKEITISMVNRYKDTWPLGIALVSSGRINLEGLVTHSFSLPQTAAALENTSTEPESLKAMIYPQRL